MTLTKIVGTALLAFVGLAGCGGAEGTYKLDKAEMKKSMEAEIAKLPAAQQGFAKLAIAMVDSMEVTVELQSGGKLKMTSSMPSFDKAKPAKTEEKLGTWKATGDAVELTADGKPLQCAKSGKKLTCTSDKKGEPSMVFIKA